MPEKRVTGNPPLPKSALPSEQCYLCLLETEQNVIFKTKGFGAPPLFHMFFYGIYG